MKVQEFTELEVWQKAHALALTIYQLTRNLPPEERYALASQMRRAAVSIPANIAEGFTRLGIADKIRFYNIAQGSAEELKYFLILCGDLRYLEERDFPRDLLGQTCRLLAGSIRFLRTRR